MSDTFSLAASFGAGASAVLWGMAVLALGLLVLARRLLRELVDKDEGTDAMVSAAEAVREGGRTLRRRLRLLAWPVAAVALVLLLLPAPSLTLRLARSVGVLAGGGATALAAVVAFGVALRADSRSASAARRSLREAFSIVVRGGGLVGLVAAAIAVLWNTAMLLSFRGDAPQVLLGSVAGACVVALGVRTGGGIVAEAAAAGLRLLGSGDGGASRAESEGSPVAHVLAGPGDAGSVDAVVDPPAVATLAAEVLRGAAGTAAELFAVSDLAFLGSILLVNVAFPGLTPARAGLVALLPLVVRVGGGWATFVGIVVRTPGGEEEPRTRDLVRGLLLTVILTTVCGFVLALALTDDLRPALAVAIGLSLAGAVTAFYGLRGGARVHDEGPVMRLPMVGTLYGEASSAGVASSAFFLLVVLSAVVAAAALGGPDLGIAVFCLALTASGMTAVAPAAMALGLFAPVARGAGSIGLMAGMSEDRPRNTLTVLLREGRSTGLVVDAYVAGCAGLTVVGLLGIALEEGTTSASAAGMIETVAPRLLVGLLVGAVVPLLTGSLMTGTVARCSAEFLGEGRHERRAAGPGSEAHGGASLSDLLARRGLLELAAPGLVAILGALVVGFTLGAGAMGASVAGALVTLPLAALVVPRDPLAPGARSPALTPLLEAMAATSIILGPAVREAAGRRWLEATVSVLAGAVVLAVLAWWYGRRPDAPWPEVKHARSG